jgi:hypothetical protein
MSLLISFKSELLKTKRSPALILTLVMAAVGPIFLLIVFDNDQPEQILKVNKDPWNFFFYQGWGFISVIFLPMFIVMLSTLLPQIEYRNQTWKQVLTTPQSFLQLYIAKFLVYQFYIWAFLFLHLLLVGLSTSLQPVIHSKFILAGHSLDWIKTFKMLGQTYIALLAVSVVQFWLGLRFKSFLFAIGIGVSLTIMGFVNMVGFPVIAGEKFFYTYSIFIVLKENVSKIPYVLWSSAAYATAFLILGFFDFRRLKGF